MNRALRSLRPRLGQAAAVMAAPACDRVARGGLPWRAGARSRAALAFYLAGIGATAVLGEPQSPQR